jgi:PucR family transcriptional regulator, purine catabolism regulatory protein
VAITVRDLLDQPHLRLKLLAGSSGLAHNITWAHSSDLADPWDWLAGGELLMRNGRTMPRTARGQVALLDGLAAAHAAGLVIGVDPATPPMTRQALTRSDDLSLPLLEVPYSMGFIVLSRAVADALGPGDDGRRAARAGRIYATVHAAVAGSGPTTFLERLEGELGYRLFVVDKSDGEPVLTGTQSPPRRLRTALLDTLERRSGAVPGVLHVMVPGSRSAVVVEVPYEEPTLLMAVSTTDEFDIPLLQHAAAATAVEMAHLAMREDAAAQIASELLRRMLDSPIEAAAVEDRLAEHRVVPAASKLIALQQVDPEGQRRLQVGLRRQKITHLLLSRGSLLFLLVSGGDAARQAVAIAEERLALEVIIGVSGDLGNTLRTTEAAREATWMLSVAARHGQRVGVFGQEASLPVFRDPTEARVLVERVLGPLLAHDRAHGSQLVGSLRTFLACRRSWEQTAAALSVHRQTVVYRMKQVRALTGRSLTETADLAELWMAITALDLVDPAAPG